MQTSNLLRLLGRTAALAAAPILLAIAVVAQTAPPMSSETPVVRKADPNPPASEEAPAKAPSAAGAGAVSPVAKSDSLLGMDVVSSDGRKVGQVAAVKTEGDGRIVEIHVKTGGFLGLGGKVVAIPAEMFAKQGKSVQLAIDSEEAGKLPALPGDRG